mmetsp:Transcript_45594/g.105791  ORF Transcript_45594/g.105791 Transcript_45594/m.105791 type:complete len:207 (-) Transcript_45594:519-1139(-)
MCLGSSGRSSSQRRFLLNWGVWRPAKSDIKIATKALNHSVASKPERALQCFFWVLEFIYSDLEQVNVHDWLGLPQQLLRHQVCKTACLQVVLALLFDKLLLHAREVGLIPALHVAFKEVPALSFNFYLRLFVLELLDVSYWSHIQRGMRWKECSSWLQVFVPGHQDAVKHAFPEQQIPHPFADDHVNLARQLDSFHCPLDHVYNVI